MSLLDGVEIKAYSEPVTIERLERALVLLAYFFEVHGDAHLPMYEKCEELLDEMRRKNATRMRARQLLESYRNGALKAIC